MYKSLLTIEIIESDNYNTIILGPVASIRVLAVKRLCKKCKIFSKKILQINQSILKVVSSYTNLSAKLNRR